MCREKVCGTNPCIREVSTSVVCGVRETGSGITRTVNMRQTPASRKRRSPALHTSYLVLHIVSGWAILLYEYSKIRYKEWRADMSQLLRDHSFGC